MHALLRIELSEDDDSNRIGEIISADVVKLLSGKESTQCTTIGDRLHEQK
jgi:hypothetical protein